MKTAQSNPLLSPTVNSPYAIIWPAEPETLEKIMALAKSNVFDHEYDHENSLIVFNSVDSASLIKKLSNVFTGHESRETRILFCNSKTPSLGTFKGVSSVSRMLHRLNYQWLVSLLDEERYTSYAQPIVSADGNWDTIGREFLFRGLTDDGELIPPDTLFSAAKDSPMLFNLDRSARIQAIKSAALLNRNEDIFINFLPNSVDAANTSLAKTVEVAKKYGVANNRIVIEIVESHQIEDLEPLRAIVKQFRAASFRIALDDFGTGYNNFDTYVALEPDFVKLDKSLTSNLSDNDARLATVKGIVRAARSSGIRTVAEGIETATNARVASDCGVDFMQGYFFGRPAPVVDTAA